MAEARRSLYIDVTDGEIKRSGVGDVIEHVSGITVIAGEPFQPGDLLYIAVSGKAFKADASNTAKKDVRFMAVESGPIIDAEYQVANPGNVIGGFTGLTPGQKQFLSEATPGARVATPPDADGEWIVKAGAPVTATKFAFQPHVVCQL